MTAPAPANLRYPVTNRLDAARRSGDWAAYADALTSLADLEIYEAAYLGVPLRGRFPVIVDTLIIGS